MNIYRGTIVAESLVDKRILNNLEVIGIRVTNEANPKDRWHLYTVNVLESDFENLSYQIKPSWYMHFWRKDNGVVIFKNRMFEIDYNDKSTWKDAIEYGLSVGIKREQLDFITS